MKLYHIITIHHWNSFKFKGQIHWTGRKKNLLWGRLRRHYDARGSRTVLRFLNKSRRVFAVFIFWLSLLIFAAFALCQLLQFEITFQTCTQRAFVLIQNKMNHSFTLNRNHLLIGFIFTATREITDCLTSQRGKLELFTFWHLLYLSDKHYSVKSIKVKLMTCVDFILCLHFACFIHFFVGESAK